MVKQIIAIGGGTFSANMKNLALESYVLKQCRKHEPSICLLPTASGDSDSYIERFYRAFTSLPCKPSHLPLFWRTPDLRSTLLKQDIIYVGGGNTKSMLAVWKEWEVPEILKEAWFEEIVLAGSSAGGICWFEQGVTDSWKDRIALIDCLGWLAGSCCPHYERNSERQITYHHLLTSKEAKPGLALSEWSAAHFHDTKLYKAVASQADANVYQSDVEDGVVVEKIVETTLLPQTSGV